MKLMGARRITTVTPPGGTRRTGRTTGLVLFNSSGRTARVARPVEPFAGAGGALSRGGSRQWLWDCRHPTSLAWPKAHTSLPQTEIMDVKELKQVGPHEFRLRSC